MLTFPSFSLNTTIEYDLVSLGNNRYQYIYTITNGASSNTDSLQLFDIQFDANLYEQNSLIIKTQPPLATDWTETFLFSVTGVAPIYDAVSLVGIADNQSVTGFRVEFTWLGAGMPSTQRFNVYNPDTLSLLEVGQTTLKQIINNPNPNPVQASQAEAVPALLLFPFYLLNISLLLLVFFYKKLEISRLK